ncbi:MAG: hypothetical protein COY40_05530 [Alphaproteobacteria bacterium CG_4_10_14_0_8_um_filter_53_9]|nr:MAG: hypothetical protein COY40_05530 [Alphaproteobacteria bacterium CG_4_10_14_0_8_um_filter_53_9]
MDMKIATVVGATSQGGSVAALPAASSQISARAAAVVSAVAADTRLSTPERTSLVQAVARFDQAQISKSTKDVLFGQVEGLGTYLRNTGNTSWPRWQQLTALRVYGLNIEQGAKSDVEEVVIAQTKELLNSLAQSSRNVSLQTAVTAPAPAAAPTAPVQVAVAQPAAAPVPVAAPAPVVQQAPAKSSAPAEAPAERVDTVV